MSVAGIEWHKTIQQAMRQRGIPYQEIEEQEYFKFGAGNVIASTRAFIYAVGFKGRLEVIKMSCVDHPSAVACPGLISPHDMGRLKVGMLFGTDELLIRDKSYPREWTDNGHPRLYLLDFPERMPPKKL